MGGFHGATDIYTRSNKNNANRRASLSLLFVRSGALKHPGPFIDNTSDRTFPRDRVKVKPRRACKGRSCVSVLQQRIRGPACAEPIVENFVPADWQLLDRILARILEKAYRPR